MAINPKWAEYNRSMNEGGEGYNPHPKFLAATPAAVVRTSGAARMIAGKMRTEAEALRFAKIALSGEQKRAFLAEVTAAFGG